MKTIRVYILLLLLQPVLIMGQEWEHPYFSYTKENGLPSNLVYGSLIDKDGLLWVCTDGGVVMFDGGNSRIFTTEDGLPSNDVYHMFCDSKNRIWFTTLKNEVSYYYNGKIYNSRNDQMLGKIKTKATFPRYDQDMRGNIWMHWVPMSLYRLDIYNKLSARSIFTDDTFNAYHFLQPDSEKIVYASGRNTIAVNLKDNKITSQYDSTGIFIRGFQKLGDNYFILDSANRVHRVFLNDIINGKFRFSTGTSKLYQANGWLYTNDRKEITLVDPTSLLESRFSVMDRVMSTSNLEWPVFWIGTFNGGIINYTISRNLHLTYLGKELSTSINSFELVGDEFLLGTNMGSLISVHRNCKKLSNINLSTTKDEKVLKISNYRYKTICLTDDGLFEISPDRRSFKSLFRGSGNFKNFAISNNEILLLSGRGLQICNSNIVPKTYFQNNKRAYAYCRYRGRRMVGTQDSLMVIDKGYHPFPLLNPFTARIMDLQTDDSLLYAVTAENGLYIIRDYQVIRNVNASCGLSSNNCFKVKIYQGNIYVATDNGISEVNGKDYSVQHIYESDGLPSGTVNDLLIDHDTLYAATEAGLSMVPLKEINLDKSYALIAKPFAVDIDTTWEIPYKVCAHSTDRLSFIFHALSYIKNTKKTYYYRIKGMNNSFSLTLDKALSFFIKHPGQFMFESYSLNAENSPSFLLRFPIIIAPMYYETLWFRVAIVLLLATTTYFSYQWFDGRVKLRENEKSESEFKMRSLELTAWRSSVNPHFLFNSLNAMQSLYQGDDFERGNKYLTYFSGILRKTVDLSGRLFVQIDEEVDYLRNFLNFEKVKRKDSFDFRIDYNRTEVGRLYIPTLVVQPVLENSIKHAFQNCSNGFMEVCFKKQGNFVVCTIRDNGPGIKDQKIKLSSSKGIQLIQAKLDIVEAITKEKISFTYSDRETGSAIDGKGFETTFIFPIFLAHYD